MYEWYEKLYVDVVKRTYSEYCVKAFGADFSQQGFSDMEQISA